MKQYYFAYGADMDPEDLELRCDMRRRQRVRFARSYKAVLEGFRLVCNLHSTYRRGGIFNLAVDPKGIVHGVAYELHPGDTISSMMIKEGESKNFLLSVMSVRVGRSVIPALVLRAEPTGKMLRPDPTYLKIVIEAARRHRLPQEWISSLKAMSAA
jgi:hypothetical protein